MNPYHAQLSEEFLVSIQIFLHFQNWDGTGGLEAEIVPASSQFRCCWGPGDTRSQGICIHFIGLIFFGTRTDKNV